MNEQLRKELYYIQGMHCRSCELLIEEKLLKIRNVAKVNVNHKRGIAEIYYSGQSPSTADIDRAVRDAGYTSGRTGEKRPFFSKDPQDYVEIFFAGGALLLIFMWLKLFGAFDFNFAFASSPKLPIVALVGLTAGVSTCMALVGGIVLAISARHSELHPEASALQKFRPHIFFNVGRIASYAFLGGIIGMIGSSFRLSSTLLGGLMILVGLVMFFLGLKLTGMFPRLSGGLTLPKSIGRIFGLNKEQKEYSHKNALLSGALTFFLPCGFTQAMQLYAMSSGSFVGGSLIMGVFALGTAPGLLGIGGITSFVKGGPARYFFKFTSLVVIVLSVVNISSGFNLTGFSLPKSDNIKVETLDSRMEDGFQVVEMTQAVGYQPNHLTIKNNVPVKWEINSTSPFSCSSYLVVPSLGISKALQAGNNEITFTPTQTGTIRFSCGMGMYTGDFNVID